MFKGHARSQKNHSCMYTDLLLICHSVLGFVFLYVLKGQPSILGDL